MGKRSDFVRRERDFYSTPLEAVTPLLPHLDSNFSFIEPCAGDGRLVNHLVNAGGNCKSATDLEPLDHSVMRMDFFDIDSFECDVITNPPWDRKFLHPMIEKLIELETPAWLLFDADWAHTKQSGQYISYCSKIVSVGRVKWIEGSKMTGKDNCAWYKFEPVKTSTQFIGR